MSTVNNLVEFEHEIFKNVFGHQLTEKPKRFEQTQSGHSLELGWVYVSQDCKHYKACRTYKTLSVFTESYTYYTPNTFYRNDQRQEGTLRWLNTIVLDVDVKNGQNVGLCLPDLFDRITAAGLPMPTMVIQTPSGGFHVYFVLDKPRKAYSNAIKQYKKIQLAICEMIGADRQAIGAERYFRIPTSENTIFRTEQRISFDELNEWYAINHESVQESVRTAKLESNGLLNHAAIKKLLEGAEIGKRDNTAYTLALAFKASGYSQEDTESELFVWNHRLDEPMKLRDVSRKVSSAYKELSPLGPSARWISDLSGITFGYQIWEKAKPRELRKSSHFHEWASDILKTLELLPDKKMTDSQRKLAKGWGMSLSSFQHVVDLLVTTGKVTVNVSGKGRGAKTTLTLIELDEVPDKEHPQIDTHWTSINVPSSNTLLLVRGAGWSSSARFHGFFEYPTGLCPGLWLWLW